MMSATESHRRLAGVTDTSWSPPPAPEDRFPNTPTDWDRADWPPWVTSPDGFAIGSRWELTRAATVVAPLHCGYPTLALFDRDGMPGRYLVDAGTRLTLVATYDADRDQSGHGLDMVSYYQWVDGWATRTYRMDEGRSAGTMVVFSADARGNRFPFSSRLAHAAVVPASAG